MIVVIVIFIIIIIIIIIIITIIIIIIIIIIKLLTLQCGVQSQINQKWIYRGTQMKYMLLTGHQMAWRLQVEARTRCWSCKYLINYIFYWFTSKKTCNILTLTTSFSFLVLYGEMNTANFGCSEPLQTCIFRSLNLKSVSLNFKWQEWLELWMRK